MKTNFRKLALAGSVAALAGASIPAQAIILGVPGEGALVPYATYFVDGAGATRMNTLVKLELPASLGSDVIQNCFTAPNTTPSGNPGQGCNNPLTYGQVPQGTPNAGGNFTNQVHWFFMNQRSEHVRNGIVELSRNDTRVFDWAQQAAGQYNGIVGYLVFTTEAGAQGLDANFAFNADAYLVYNNTANVNPIADSVVEIPTLALSDAADAGATQPTANNNIVEWMGGQWVIQASPLVTGERTIWADGLANNYVYDLPLANNLIAGANNNGTDGTIMVFWNDRNVLAWNNITALRWNNNEQFCSTQVSLPDELNVWYVPPGNASNTATYSQGDFIGFPGLWRELTMLSPYSTTTSSEAGSSAAGVTALCNVAADNQATFGLTGLAGGVPANSNRSNFVDGGFVSIVAPEPANPATFALEGAAVFWSWPVSTGAAGTNVAAGTPRATLLGHNRGAFNVIN